MASKSFSHSGKSYITADFQAMSKKKTGAVWMRENKREKRENSRKTDGDMGENKKMEGNKQLK